MSEQNRKIFVISDTHWSHANIIRYCHRPFADIEEMDQRMIDNWNAIVRPEDIVYHIGDVYFGPSDRADRILSRLMGRKRLLLGNHDDGKDPILQKHFQKIGVWRMFPEYQCVLSHIPLNESCLNPVKCPINVHGHIHNNYQIHKFGWVNVSVEMINYTPVELPNLIDEYKRKMNYKRKAIETNDENESES